MNKLFISGNLTKEPETRVTTKGDPVCNFTVGVTRRSSGEQSTDFFRVSAWGKMAEACQTYLHKGSRVNVVGSVSLSLYEDKNTGQQAGALNVSASDVEFISSPER